ncbi:MAG: hypothetical protein J6D53_11950 [Blautia sp.]|nr:hypothetical protein [Blautia sp.]
MTANELKVFLKEHRVPGKYYKIGGRHNHRICMEKTDSGWEVFFSDNRDKVGLTQYNDEASACKGMKDEIRKLMELVHGMTWAEK